MRRLRLNWFVLKMFSNEKSQKKASSTSKKDKKKEVMKTTEETPKSHSKGKKRFFFFKVADWNQWDDGLGAGAAGCCPAITELFTSFNARSLLLCSHQSGISAEVYGCSLSAWVPSLPVREEAGFSGLGMAMDAIHDGGGCSM